MSEPHSYGIAIFADKDGRRVIYQLRNPLGIEPETDVAHFKPRSLVTIMAVDHEGGERGFVYYPPGEDHRG